MRRRLLWFLLALVIVSGAYASSVGLPARIQTRATRRSSPCPSDMSSAGCAAFMFFAASVR